MKYNPLILFIILLLGINIPAISASFKENLYNKTYEHLQSRSLTPEKIKLICDQYNELTKSTKSKNNIGQIITFNFDLDFSVHNFNTPFNDHTMSFIIDNPVELTDKAKRTATGEQVQMREKLLLDILNNLKNSILSNKITLNDKEQILYFMSLSLDQITEQILNNNKFLNKSHSEEGVTNRSLLNRRYSMIRAALDVWKVYEFSYVNILNYLKRNGYIEDIHINILHDLELKNNMEKISDENFLRQLNDFCEEELLQTSLSAFLHDVSLMTMNNPFEDNTNEGVIDLFDSRHKGVWNPINKPISEIIMHQKEKFYITEPGMQDNPEYYEQKRLLISKYICSIFQTSAVIYMLCDDFELLVQKHSEGRDAMSEEVLLSSIRSIYNKIDEIEKAQQLNPNRQEINKYKKISNNLLTFIKELSTLPR